jgi:single-strand DNA-binding protein
MNIWLGEGNLATVPEVREYNGGKTVCKFLMAVSRHPGKREAGRDLMRVVAWDKQAINISRYLTKGSRVLVQGRIHSEFYQRDESTAARLNTEIYADSVTFLTPPPNATATVTAPAGTGRGR